ncbi:phage Gp37/Gp68 family protein [Burkholderia cenocepacia]|uniref:phage Gp37/Gp68 family protein n=1 Tax=Burkholderia cenocepacia TaxID=95486 RepID=UPI00223052C0|nr:phage Gp37/Gp68 family protein [Burkholderia cenocepacia]MCW3542234.1 phage Gp37/Gp68 family protein [Burkholderia cenocepacia]
MSENTKIEWCDHTFNPWEGCQKVGPGCDHCYAETRNARFGGGTAVNWGPGAPRRRTSPANWRKPLAWESAHAEFFAAHGRRQRVFCASLADVFDNAVDPAWRADLFTLIERTPNLDWLLLTKRIGNVMSMVGEAAQYQFDLDCIERPRLHDNVSIGATIVNREEMLRDAEKLLAVPARMRFWSVEPMLADLGEIPTELMPDWVICGGESGSNARPMHPDWARNLRDQCAAAGVPFLFKQWGEWAPGENCGGRPMRTERVADWFGDEWSFSTMAPSEHDGLSYDDEPTVYRVGKKTAGRHLDGRAHDEFPEAR